MGLENAQLIAFNRGLISKLALARVDLKRAAMSAEVQTNWMPRVLGSMMIRPGLEYKTATYLSHKAVGIPFVADEENLGDSAAVELSDYVMRVLIDDTPITRPTVTAAVTNPDFTSNLTGWTDNDEAGAQSQWVTGGLMELVGTGYNSARRTQQVTVNQAGTMHALNIDITRGPVVLKVGTTSGGDDYISETTLQTGVHSLAFTPSAGSFYIDFSSLQKYGTYVNSCTVAPAGIMTLTTPWPEDALSLLRWDTSGDVIFVACSGYKQKRIERRGTNSWSIVDYVANDGPFRPENLTPTTLTPSGISGNITLTASENIFKPTHVGALFRVQSSLQFVTANLNGNNQFTNTIRVTGVGATRAISVSRTGTWTGTLTLQRSLDGISNWEDVATYTTNAVVSYNDTLDNQVWYYRIGFDAGGYGSGTATVSLTYNSGSITGIVRVQGYISPTQVYCDVIKELGAFNATPYWSEGAWSAYRGYPSAVALFEGRLWWAGKDKIYGSVSDAFDSFDDTIEGNSAPIERSVGSGPVARINWLLPLLRLVVGTKLSERTARSSSLDEPLTAGNFNLKDASTRGNSPIPAAKIDSSGVFVRDTRLFMLNNSESVAADYVAKELTLLCPEVGDTGFTRIAVQRYPDTRVHCLRGDGTAGILVFDEAEEVKCWVEVETPGADGFIEDVYIMPGDEGDSQEDKVYYIVRRTINGSTVRYHERWAMEEECLGKPNTGGLFNTYRACKLADCSITKVIPLLGSSTITGLSHLEGQQVVVWAATNALGDNPAFNEGVALEDEDGEIALFTVTGGEISLTHRGEEFVASYVTVGLPYEADFKSYKLAYAASLGSALGQVKKVTGLALVAAYLHAKGLKYGTDPDNLSPMPEVEDTGPVDPDHIWEQYDKMSFEVDGEFGTDTRIFLKAQAPRPATVLGIVPTVVTYDRA